MQCLAHPVCNFSEILTWAAHREALGRIMTRGHSRVPVYSNSPQNIVGLLLVSFSSLSRVSEGCPVCASFDMKSL